MTVGSLFSGIGGFDLGLERAGLRVVWQCEADPQRRAVLRRHWPQTPIYEAVEAVDASAPRVDVLAGGFPCKDVSSSGRRAGIEGKHSGLWAEFARVIRALRPRYVLVENVPGLLVDGMGRVVGDLAASGYDAEWDVLPAAAWGAPHLRARLWILAYPRGERDEADDTVFAGRAVAHLRDRWPAEPDAPRVDDGLPGWVVRAYGDSLVVPIAEWLGERILEAEETRRAA